MSEFLQPEFSTSFLAWLELSFSGHTSIFKILRAGIYHYKEKSEEIKTVKIPGFG